MTHFLVICSLVVCFCIRDTENVQIPCTTHRRPRSYLIYEKGSAITMTTSAVTSFLPRVPQGLNFLSEETLYYELPSSVSIPTPAPGTTKSPLKEVKWKSVYSSHWPAPSKRWAEAGVAHMYKRNAQQSVMGDNGLPFDLQEDIGTLFFQQLNRFAENYGFNGRHCVLRTICEAKHFLYPKGQSLFHDIIRIILEYSLPGIMRDKKYFTASRVVNPMECANLYGPHCRISFLDYFTLQVHGKFM